MQSALTFKPASSDEALKGSKRKEELNATSSVRYSSHADTYLWRVQVVQGSWHLSEDPYDFITFNKSLRLHRNSLEVRNILFMLSIKYC